MDIYVNMREPLVPENVLGPYTRYCLWVSGCNRNCPGCISPESHDMYAGTKRSISALAWEIIPSEVEGITVSGGEPFLQAKPLSELIRTVKRHRDIGVIIYTGFLFEQLSEIEGGKELAALCDLIIDGPYIKELDDGKALRGSSNQRVISLTDRYKKHLSLYGSGERKTRSDSSLSFEVKEIGLPTNSEYH